MLYKGLNGSFLLQYKLYVESFADTCNITEVSGRVIQEYFSVYQKHYRDIQKDFNFSGNLASDSGSAYSTILFDQVWSYAHALNQSLPQLQSGNLSLANYTNGNKMIAEIVEDQLSKLNIKGLNGKIRFNRKRVVPSTIQIEIVRNESAISHTLLGIYTDSSLQKCLNLTPSDVPADCCDLQFITVHTSVVCLISFAIFTAALLVTLNLMFFLFCRDKTAVKAASPKLSLFMFAGCYLLCLTAIFHTTQRILGGIYIKNANVYKFLCIGGLFIDQNGYNLILAALFIKLLRIHQVFSNKYLKNLSNMWKNSSLAVIVIALCLIQNISSIIIAVTIKYTYNSTVIFTHNTTDENGVYLQQKIFSCSDHLLYTISYLPLVVYFIVITYLAITTRRVKDGNYKDTKKVTLFVAIVAVLMVAYIVSWWFLLKLETQMVQFTVIVQTLFPLAVAMACQVVLFTPKVLPTCWSELKILIYN